MRILNPVIFFHFQFEPCMIISLFCLYGTERNLFRECVSNYCYSDNLFFCRQQMNKTNCLDSVLKHQNIALALLHTELVWRRTSLAVSGHKGEEQSSSKAKMASFRFKFR